MDKIVVLYYDNTLNDWRFAYIVNKEVKVKGYLVTNYISQTRRFNISAYDKEGNKETKDFREKTYDGCELGCREVVIRELLNKEVESFIYL